MNVVSSFHMQSHTPRKAKYFDGPATTTDLLTGSCSGSFTVLDGLNGSDRPATISKSLKVSASGSLIILDGS